MYHVRHFDLTRLINSCPLQLGIFLCMRCAAIHRKLGTHISKVKSLSMDSWTNEQVDVRLPPISPLMTILQDADFDLSYLSRK
jgi:hypothetical protein